MSRTSQVFLAGLVTIQRLDIVRAPAHRAVLVKISLRAAIVTIVTGTVAALVIAPMQIEIVDLGAA